MAKHTDKLKEKLRERQAPKPPDPAAGLSTGSTVLNLACTGSPSVGLLPGGFYLFVGDSGSGKTWLNLGILAEAANHPKYKKHKLVFHNAENGALMNVRRYFGAALDERLQLVQGKSNSLERDFYDNVEGFLGSGPCVYLLDSMDVLVPDAWAKRTQEAKRARDKGKEPAGSYGTEKAKINSERLRPIVAKLRDTGSLLIMISQTRDNIGFGSQFQPKTRGGGLAMTFYATLEIWSSVKAHLRTTYKGNPVEQGIVCKFLVKKNREAGRPRTALVPIAHGHGVDDIGGNIDYLVQWGHWPASGKGEPVIDAHDFGVQARREKLAETIEAKGWELDLRALVADVWDEVEDSVAVRRKPRYQ